MLITFSGIVGSGKSTNAKQVHRFLQEAGYPSVYLRFRFLKARKILRALFRKNHHALTPKKAKPAHHSAALRHQAILRLTLTRTLVYLWRIVLFRLFATLRLRRKIIVIDRFYYDSLVHYALSGRLERLYLQLIKIVLPTPQLALMLIARPQTILRRRPNYDSTYIQQLHQHYQQMIHAFPYLVVLPTDNVNNLAANILHQVHQTVAHASKANPLQPQMLL